MAIEQLWHSTDGEIGYGPKLVVHPALPLAIANVGFRQMPDDTLITDHVRELIANLTAAQLHAATVRQLLVERFLEPCHQLRDAFGHDNPSAHMDFYVAVVDDGAVRLTVTKLHDEAVDQPGPVWIDGPTHVGACYEQEGMLSGAYIYGEPNWNADQVVDRLVHIVRTGIDCDEHSGLDHRYAGGTIDVAIVREGNVEHREL
jgi:hypothetical protein